MISRNLATENKYFSSIFGPSSDPRRRLYGVISVLILLGIIGGTFLSLNLFSLISAHAAASNTAVLTYKGDNYHTGQYPNETTLNTSNVIASSFGKRISYPVDGQVYAQPLYVPNVTINGSTHNVVYVATEHDSLYAFDADQTTSKAPIWQTSLLGNGTSPSNVDVSCNDMIPEDGLSSTPVIDPQTNTLYIVAFTKENGNFIYRLHALDLASGQEKAGSPTIIQGSVAGKGTGSVNGKITFNAQYERQRSALLLSNGKVYVAFGSFCDVGPYHGWIMSYSYSGGVLQQSAIYNSTANGQEGGLWAGGGPLVADSQGNIYFSSGNGDFDLNVSGGVNASDAILKLTSDLKVLDYFAAFNQVCLQQADADLGSGGPLLIPGTSRLIQAGKEGRVYVLNTNNMGKFTNDPNLSCASTSPEQKRQDVDKIVQELYPKIIGGIYTVPSFYNNTVYFGGVHDNIKAFAYDPTTGKLSAGPTSQSAETYNFTGGNTVISSNNGAAGTGVLWVIDPLGILRAYDPTNLSRELYNSNSGRDSLDSYVKFSTPIVANGEVFVGTKTSLTIYSTLSTPTGTPTPTPTGTPTPPTPTPTPAPGTASFNNVGISSDTQPGIGNFDGGNRSYSATALLYNGINPGDNTFYKVSYKTMVFTWPDVPAGQPDNYVPAGQTIPVSNPIANANLLGFLGASSGGPTYGSATINYTDGSTQKFTLGFSDWTLGGGTAPVSFGNGRLATMSYRNTVNGFQAVNNYVFYADVTLQAGKTPQSVTLPAQTTGGQMHIFAISTANGTITTNPTPTVPYNNVGMSSDTAPASGNFDGTASNPGSSYSSQAAQAVGLIPGTSVYSYGSTFIWPAADSGTPNNYAINGQTITIPISPVASAQTLTFLGASTNGNSQGSATITYDDGSTQPFMLGFSDWVLGGDMLAPAYNNKIALSMPYRNQHTGKQAFNTFVFYTDVALAPAKNIVSVTLPTTTTGGQMHIFSVSTKSDPSLAVAPYNSRGTSADNQPASAAFDAGGASYSRQALQNAGVTPGGNFNMNGATFIWPSGVGATANNYIAGGQVVPVNSVYGATTIAFLGSSINGPSQGNITITYADGKTQTESLGFSDWTLNAGKQAPTYGNQTAFKLPYRNTPGGKQNVSTYVFESEFILSYNEPVVSVTLPTSAQTAGHMHIFSVATH
ncbi:hypothetical protein [Dictyobacter arantiisoli]|uniref:Pyrrolo-quinoline quinone n=1 Tax=Dictyobacter arantiisoli TaxID=2014874 RepID=A0A5A5T666_9CHLR|nr:hypothetical protein [Dictyobacter arantiisoli]GCF06725.1 hypothetical protein KDI_02890 [Dictyobacter arantiisoli]